jgi:hypothetical protein
LFILPDAATEVFFDLNPYPKSLLNAILHLLKHLPIVGKRQKAVAPRLT